MNTAFLTGSQVYGTPRPDSDVDLVVLMEPSEAVKFCELLGNNVSNYGERTTYRLTVGGLDIVVHTTEESFIAWKVATNNLKQRAPVDRDEAVATIKRSVALFNASNQPAR